MLTQGLCILDLAESHVLQLPPFATSNSCHLPKQTCVHLCRSSETVFNAKAWGGKSKEMKHKCQLHTLRTAEGGTKLTKSVSSFPISCL